MKKVYRIQLAADLRIPAGSELFPILERLLPVKFILGAAPRGNQPDAAIIRNHGAEPHPPGIPTLAIGQAGPASPLATTVEFSDQPGVPLPFRGRTVEITLPQTAAIGNREQVLAASLRGAVWTRASRNGVTHYQSALPLPHIIAGQNFSDVFNGECFMEMLILLHFLGEVSAAGAYRHAPLRAGFIIDDPNLHWPSYGFVNYRHLAAQAQKHRYHVSFATIPLDAWYTHAATARLFRANSQWLSLLVHGNNHAKQELARVYPQMAQEGLLQQALRRIDKLETQSAVPVSRVMVPPHGACSETMLAALGRSAFESACISAGSLRAHNRYLPWTSTLGYLPAELIQGCPVLPRWGLNGKVRNTLLLAAYLGQPMILRGHHQDLRNGTGVFDEYADFINSLGQVCWPGMTGLSRLNYLWREDGDCCRIRPLGKKITFTVPGHSTGIVLEDPGLGGVWQAAQAGWAKEIRPGCPLPLPLHSGCEITISRALTPEFPQISSLQPPGAALIARRLLTEARDRLAGLGLRSGFGDAG